MRPRCASRPRSTIATFVTIEFSNGAGFARVLLTALGARKFSDFRVVAPSPRSFGSARGPYFFRRPASYRHHKFSRVSADTSNGGKRTFQNAVGVAGNVAFLPISCGGHAGFHVCDGCQGVFDSRGTGAWVNADNHITQTGGE